MKRARVYYKEFVFIFHFNLLILGYLRMLTRAGFLIFLLFNIMKLLYFINYKFTSTKVK